MGWQVEVTAQYGLSLGQVQVDLEILLKSVVSDDETPYRLYT